MLGDPAFRATGWRRAIDQIMMHGLEKTLKIYLGVYRAEVVDNTDSDNKGLIKIRCPAVGDQPGVAREAYPMMPFAGAGYGLKFVPPKGSYVWVEFERGKLDMPVYRGGWWAKGEMPSDLESVDTFGLVTPAGHQIILADDLGREFVRVRHKNGGVVEIDAAGNMTLANGASLIPGVETTVSVGKDADEAAVKGDTLKGLLEELIDAITQLTVVTPTGLSSPPVNVATFIQIKTNLITLLSDVVKVK